MSRTFNILSIDGGGIRGVFTARLLERLGQRCPQFLGRVALFAGTSTGGILALGLAHGLGPKALGALYRDNAEKIFRKRWFGGWFGAKYSLDGLKAALTGAFGDVTLGELQRYVLVAAYDLDAPEKAGRPRTGKAKFFESVGDAHELARDVGCATAAAPTFFASDRGYIDGGVAAINPSMSAIAQAVAWGTAPEDLRILSLGTGVAREFIAGDANDWGLMQWAPKLAPLMIDGPGGVADFQCSQLFGGHYLRLDGSLPEPIAMDDVSAIERLIELADAVDVDAACAWLEESGWMR